MNVIIIGNKKDTDLLKIENMINEYPDVEFIISEEKVDSEKQDLIIFMKEMDNYDMKGKKSLFLENEIEKPKNMFIISFADINSNISKINHLINIFLS